MFGFLRYTQPVARRLRSLQIHWRRPLRVEELESRTLLNAYGPSQILHAYGFDRLPYDGSGQTIAIVDAYDNPNVAYDLGVFDQRFGLPDPVLTVAQPQGQPPGEVNWGLEIDLDVQWAHAIAPGANILLVEARSDFFNDVMAAVDYARQQPGVVAVSMSWGANESSFLTRYDPYFRTPTGHVGGSGLPGGVTFVAASGDSGANVEWPAVAPNVLSIGGTALTLNDNNEVVSETGWSRSGGGVSRYEPQPDFQGPFQSYGKRTTPDFAYNADLYSPYWIYDSYGYGGTLAVYGTSAGAPQWAALIALADQGLALNNFGSLDGATQTLPALYNLASVSYGTYYNDIVDGNNGYQAGPGYDLVTGIGSPIADQVVGGLVNVTPPGGGGGAAAPSADRGTQANLAQETFWPGSPPRFLPISAPVPDQAGAVARSPRPRRGDFANQTVIFLLASANTSPTTSALPSSPSKAASVGTDRNAAVAFIEPTLTSLSRLSESRVESGGGGNAALANGAKDDGAADNAVFAVSESALGGDWEVDQRAEGSRQ